MHRISLWVPVSCLALYACSSSVADGPGAMGTTGGTPPHNSTGGSTSTTGGSNTTTGGTSVIVPTGGSTATGGSASTGGASTGGGANTGGATATGGATTGGATTGGATTGGSGGDMSADGDTPPVRPLNITASLGRHNHTVDGRPFAVDTRAPKMMGKLIIDLGVDSGGIYNFAVNRGFHCYGGQIFHCDLNYDDLTHNGNCRLETIDGQDHDPTVNITYEQSVSGRLAASLKQLQTDFPEEDWGYFLTADGKVRWSDVGITGFSHGAQTAARVGRAMRVYRAVSRSGPRDNECGRNDQMPPYDVNCTRFSAWLDEPSMTPIDRFFAFVGLNDGQRGDDQFSMERMGYIGEPVDINTVPPPYNGSHRFLASGEGHSGFDDEKYWPALGIAWGVPQENMDHAAGL